MATSVRVELYTFGFVLDDPILGILDTGTLESVSTGTAVDITSDLRSLSIKRGRQRDLDEFTPGTCSLVLENVTRKYDPTNSLSSLYGQTVPQRPLKVTAVVGGVDYPLFYGYVQDWAVDYSVPLFPMASVTAADGLANLARQTFAGTATYGFQTSGNVVSAVLLQPEVSWPAAQSIDAGLTTLATMTLTGNVLQFLQTVARTELGDLYASNTGTLVYKQRNNIGSTSSASFIDDGASTSIGYSNIEQVYSTDLLFNRVSVTGTTGNKQTAENTQSEQTYGVRALDRSGLFSSDDTEMLNQASYLAARFGTPEMRLRQVTVVPLVLPAARQAELFALDLTSRVFVSRTPPGGGSPASVSQPARVDGLEWQFGNGLNSWKATVSLSSSARVTGFMLDDTVLGVLDTDFLSY